MKSLYYWSWHQKFILTSLLSCGRDTTEDICSISYLHSERKEVLLFSRNCLFTGHFGKIWAFLGNEYAIRRVSPLMDFLTKDPFLTPPSPCRWWIIHFISGQGRRRCNSTGLSPKGPLGWRVSRFAGRWSCFTDASGWIYNYTSWPCGMPVVY